MAHIDLKIPSHNPQKNTQKTVILGFLTKAALRLSTGKQKGLSH